MNTNTSGQTDYCDYCETTVTIVDDSIESDDMGFEYHVYMFSCGHDSALKLF